MKLGVYNINKEKVYKDKSKYTRKSKHIKYGIRRINIPNKIESEIKLTPKTELTNVLQTLKDLQQNKEIGDEDISKAIKVIEDLIK